MIDRHKLSVANKVLNAISRLSKGHKFILETYSNGREQGYALLIDKTYSKKVAFSESRGSDHIVVFFGNSDDFDFIGNVPSYNVYKTAKFFSPYETEKAANFIIEQLTLQ